jgi:YVTN family beta-propeller protein
MRRAYRSYPAVVQTGATVSQTIDPRLGSNVGGYRIESLIGRGGMSVVYLAEDLHLGRKVALKLLAPELAQDEKFRERFVRESRLAASLEHPNIVTVFEARETDGLLYIAMRLVAGTDLKTLIGREAPLDPERTISILSQVAAALDTAHAEGLIHRDVKPGNILITPRSASAPTDRVYLSDFGLTKRATSDSGITATGQFVGTLDYAAPEQFEGKPVDGRADGYSLGCVLYECLTGEVPYARENQAALVYAHLQAPVPKVTAKRPELPFAIDLVVARAMAKRAEDRYQSAGELASAAAAALGVQPVTATTPTGPVAGPPRGRRLGLLMGVGAAVVAAVVAVVVLLNGGGGSTPAAGPTTGAAASLVDYVVRVDTSTGRVSEPIRVGKDPVSVAISEGSAWVANNGENTVSRLDPVTGKVTATIEVGRGPFAVVAGEGAVWVGSHRETTISRIEPATNEVTDFDVGIAPESMAVGGGAVWIAYDRGFAVDGVVIQKFDAATGRFVADVVVPGEDIRGFGGTQSWAMVELGDSLWAGGFSGRLFRIDGQSLQIVDQIALSGAPIVSIWAQGDSVWVGANGTPGTVFRVDPGSNEVASTIPAGGGKVGPVNQPMSGAADDRDVWVTDTVNGTVSRIVVLSGQAAAPIQVGKVPTGLALGLGSVWVTVDG